ncbi:hypothetical protein IWX64_003332 [Arthrobacter sp. CAN_A212]
MDLKLMLVLKGDELAYSVVSQPKPRVLRQGVPSRSARQKD